MALSVRLGKGQGRGAATFLGFRPRERRGPTVFFLWAWGLNMLHFYVFFLIYFVPFPRLSHYLLCLYFIFDNFSGLGFLSNVTERSLRAFDLPLNRYLAVHWPLF